QIISRDHTLLRTLFLLGIAKPHSGTETVRNIPSCLSEYSPGITFLIKECVTTRASQTGQRCGCGSLSAGICGASRSEPKIILQGRNRVTSQKAPAASQTSSLHQIAHCVSVKNRMAIHKQFIFLPIE